MFLFVTGFAVILNLISTGLAADFVCPTRSGYYPDPEQCDRYFECRNGKAQPKMCGDGLGFVVSSPLYERCDLLHNVDCGDRQYLQEAKSSPHCERQFGYYPHEDPTRCREFYQCVHGVASTIKCQQGLVFNPDSATCEWPKDGKDCDNYEETLDTDFACPVVGERFDVAARYPHPTDCDKFYICVHGKYPSLMQCQKGKAYNTERLMCDDPANVPDCSTDKSDKSDKKTKRSVNTRRSSKFNQ